MVYFHSVHRHYIFLVMMMMPVVERSFQSANQLFYDSATTAAVGPLEVSQEDDEGEFDYEIRGGGGEETSVCEYTLVTYLNRECVRM